MSVKTQSSATASLANTFDVLPVMFSEEQMGLEPKTCSSLRQPGEGAGPTATLGRLFSCYAEMLNKNS